MEERIVESRSAFPSSHFTLSEKVEAEMSDGEWFAKQQLMKPVQIGRVEWNTTQARDTDIFDVSFPEILSENESVVLRTLRMYAFYKISPCFRVQINSTFFHKGQLICTFDPFSFSSRDVTNPDKFDIYYATGLPNVKIMASESDAIELCCPYIHPRSFLTTNNETVFNNLGRFRITVLNPLSVADGTTPSITVSIWAYAKDAQVHVPIFDHEPILEPPQVEATSGMISDVLGTGSRGLGQTTEIIGNLVSGNFGQALRKGQGLVDTLGKLLGFDYPARTIQPPKTISPVENLSVAIGQSQSQRMALDPFSMHQLQDAEAGESMRGMDLKMLIKMPMLLNQYRFADNYQPGSLLASIPVTPLIANRTAIGLRRSYLSFISNAFTYWTGGIDFDIEVVATRFHSGKLLVAYVPNSQEPPTFIQAQNSLPNVLLDIQQTSKLKFKVPYTSATPLKNIPVNTDISEILPSNFPDACIGTLCIYVQNTLTHTSNVSPDVEFNVYISAGEDFNLYVPSRPVVDKTFGPPVVATSGIGYNVNKNNENATVVLTKDQNNSIQRNHFGEDYSLLDYLRRFSYLTTYVATSDPEAEQFAVIGGLVAPYNQFTDTNVRDSIMGYFSRIYNCWSGSIRYKFVINKTRNDNITATLVHYPSTITPNNMYQIADAFDPLLTIGLATLRTNTCQDLAIESEVPYYSKYNMILTRQVPGYNDIFANGSLVLNLAAKDASGVNVAFSASVDIYISAGEDFRFVYPRPPPQDLTSIAPYIVSTV